MKYTDSADHAVHILWQHTNSNVLMHGDETHQTVAVHDALKAAGHLVKVQMALQANLRDNWDFVQDMGMCMLLHEADYLVCLDPEVKSLCHAFPGQGPHKQVGEPTLSPHKKPQNSDL